MALIVAVVNQKGGVGKTTTAVNVSAALAEAGKRVLLIDADPQGNASSGLGFSLDDQPVGLYQVLSGEQSLDEASKAANIPNLTVLPSSIDLTGVEIELAASTSRTELKDSLQPADGQYDYILIDTPPSLGVMTLTCLVAAGMLLIPIQCEYYALEGLRQLMRTIDLVRHALNPDLKILGLVRTMYDGRTNLSQQVSAELEKFFPRDIFSTIIPRSVRLSEAPSYGEPIITYDPRSVGAEAYRALAREILDRTGVSPIEGATSSTFHEPTIDRGLLSYPDEQKVVHPSSDNATTAVTDESPLAARQSQIEGDSHEPTRTG